MTIVHKTGSQASKNKINKPSLLPSMTPPPPCTPPPLIPPPPAPLSSFLHPQHPSLHSSAPSTPSHSSAPSTPLLIPPPQHPPHSSAPSTPLLIPPLLIPPPPVPLSSFLRPQHPSPHSSAPSTPLPPHLFPLSRSSLDCSSCLMYCCRVSLRAMSSARSSCSVEMFTNISF